MKIYLVGGAVRDKLLGLPVKDRDWVVVGATVKEMLDQGYRQVGKDFPVFLHPQSHEEYALARTERKQGKGYTGFVVHASPEVTLEEDLARRDLTINALAEDSDGHIVDPFGGQADIEQRLLRHVSPAFSEDPLRVLRVARFAARFHHLDFRIADETLALMWAMTQRGELQHLVAERVWQESSRALLSASPARYIEVLRHCGALKVIWPELQALFGIPRRSREGLDMDCGLHSLAALTEAAALSDSLPVRFAALCHGVGQALTPPPAWPAHPDKATQGLPRLEDCCQRLRVPNDCRELATLCLRLHSACDAALAADADALLGILEGADALRKPARFAELLQACETIFRSDSEVAQPYPQARHLQRALAAAQSVETAPIIAAGHRGAAIGEALRAARLDAIKTALDTTHA